LIRSWDGADGGAVRSNISDTKRTHQSGEATPGKAAARSGLVEAIPKRFREGLRVIWKQATIFCFRRFGRA